MYTTLHGIERRLDYQRVNPLLHGNIRKLESTANPRQHSLRSAFSGQSSG
jgi:hypothetical protein